MMSEDTGRSNPCLVKSSKDTADWKLCMLCQDSTSSEGMFVKIPRTESYHKLLDVVEEWGSLHDGIYVDIQGHLKQFNKETLIEKKLMWHRGCYSDAINKIYLQRARDAYSMPCLQEAMLRKNVEIKV